MRHVIPPTAVGYAVKPTNHEFLMQRYVISNKP
jgi:hypothetical protein